MHTHIILLYSYICILYLHLYLQPSPPSAELQPADVDKMVKPIPAFEGLRLEGDNIHRGQGNYKVSRYKGTKVVNLHVFDNL